MTTINKFPVYCDIVFFTPHQKKYEQKKKATLTMLHLTFPEKTRYPNCNRYIMNYSNQSVNGIIFNKDKTAVLLIKRRDVPVWVLPGGGIEINETPEEAVIREVKEETGFFVKISRKIAEYTPLCRLTRYTHFFECHIQGGTSFAGDETKEVRFFPLKTLPKRLPPPYPDWIKDATCFYSYLVKKEITSITYFVVAKSLVKHPILTIRFLLTKIGITFNAK